MSRETVQYGKFKDQDFESLHSECIQRGKLFEDHEFPASDDSLNYETDREVKWLRPKNIGTNAKFYVKNFSRFDIQQSDLGDCWLLAGIITLTQHRKLFDRVVSRDQSFGENYAGIFHFRFWQYGQWIDVVIDDRLPTVDGELMFSQSTQSKEFWPALLEKAYAKLQGSYGALDSGYGSEAMVDLTGGVTEIYKLRKAPRDLFDIMLKAQKHDSMMTCLIEVDTHNSKVKTRRGLITGHVYSITKVELLSDETTATARMFKLVRLKNPWGSDEWNGPWSDDSSKWRTFSDGIKRRIGMSEADDGEFWMSFSDWKKYFDSVELCHLSPNLLAEEQNTSSRKKWQITMFEGEWKRNTTAGGRSRYMNTFWRNPQYFINIGSEDGNDDDNTCTVVIGLMQKNRRNTDLDDLKIGFEIYPVTEDERKNKPLERSFFEDTQAVVESPFEESREVSCRLELGVGSYVIVPTTYRPNEEGEFMIRVFSERQITE